MTWVALKMLTGDRSKYLGILFGIAFAALLMAHQVSIFLGIMARTTSVIDDVNPHGIWVMNPNVRYLDEPFGMSDMDLERVRGVEGVGWAVRFYKGQLRTRLAGGNDPGADSDFRNVMLLGLDDATFTGAPRRMLLGNLEDLKKPDAVIVDEAGWNYLFPGRPWSLGHILEMNDRRAVLVGICKASPPFQSVPVMYTRYSQAIRFAPPERRVMSFVLAGPAPGHRLDEVCQRIQQQTGLRARTGHDFSWDTIRFYLKNTGIPVNFGITVTLGFIVGVAIAGQTFYLFTIENLKQFGALKAMGVSNWRIVGMILTQAFVVGVIGYCIGMGLAATFFESTKSQIHLQGFYMRWQVMLLAGAAVLVIVTLASLLSIRRVLVLEPAIVFR